MGSRVGFVYFVNRMKGILEIAIRFCWRFRQRGVLFKSIKHLIHEQWIRETLENKVKLCAGYFIDILYCKKVGTMSAKC